MESEWSVQVRPNSRRSYGSEIKKDGSKKCAIADVEMQLEYARRRGSQVAGSSNSSSYEKHVAGAQNLIDLELYEATRSGFDRRFKEVLKNLTLSAILEGVSPSGNTMLHVAAKFNHGPIAELIVSVCPSLLTKKNPRGDTALHLAARAGHRYMAEILFHIKCEQVVSSPSGNAGNTATEKYVNKELLRLANDDGNTALHEALVHGHEELAEELIKADPEVSFCANEENKSPLCLAAEAGYRKCIAQMLEQPADKNADERLQAEKSAIGVAIINAATKRGATDILDAMLEKEPQLIYLRDEYQRTTLHLAASIGYLKGVSYVLEKHRFAALQRDKNGLFPVHVASTKGHVTIIEELLRHFPYPEEMLTNNCQNILHVAAKSGSFNGVNYILKAKKFETLINQRDRDGNTPLHLAAMNCHPKIVSILTRDKRVNLELVNKERFTALGVVEYHVEEIPSFQKRLTWAALRAAGTPRALFPYTNPQRKAYAPRIHPCFYNDRVNTLLLVSTLIATVTFAAGFTAPGGYNDSDPDKGMAALLKHKVFCLFILCDMIAMYSSITIAVALIWAQLNDLHLVYFTLRFVLPLLGVALVMMSLAFMAGVYLVISKLQWLGYLVVITGLLFVVVLSMLFFPLCVSYSSSSRIIRFMFFYAFDLLVLLTSSHTRGHGSSEWWYC